MRVRPRQLCQPPAPAVWGEWVSGWLVVYERFISPRPVGPQFCPDPSPRPLPASCGLVALGPREGSLGRECSPGSPRLIRPRTRQRTPRPPRAPPPPQTPAPHRRVLIHALAGCREERAGGPESWSPLDSKFILQTQRSPSPNPTLAPAPRTCPGFAAPPQGARFSALAPGQRDKGTGLVSGGWEVACCFLRKEGVARVGSRCPACPDLLLGRCAPDPRSSWDWALEEGRHFRPESSGHQVGSRPSPVVGLPGHRRRRAPGRADGGS